MTIGTRPGANAVRGARPIPVQLAHCRVVDVSRRPLETSCPGKISVDTLGGMMTDTVRRIGIGAAAVACAAALITGSVAGNAAARETGFPGSAGEAVLGPAGYKTLQLGMAEDAAVATGLVVDRQTIGQCHWYRLAASEGRQNPGNGVIVSPSRGVVSIPGTESSRTPEGIVMGSVDNSAGSTLDQVKRAYPDLVHRPGDPDFIFRTPVPAHFGTHYGFATGDDDRVKDMNLTSDDDGGCGLDSAAGQR